MRGRNGLDGVAVGQGCMPRTRNLVNHRETTKLPTTTTALLSPLRKR